MMPAERIRLRHPDRTKAGPNIERSRYELVRKQILALVPRSGPGIAWTDLRDAAHRGLGTRLAGGNNWWYTSVVKLHLEAIGEIERSGGSPQRLLRSR